MAGTRSTIDLFHVAEARPRRTRRRFRETYGRQEPPQHPTALAGAPLPENGGEHENGENWAQDALGSPTKVQVPPCWAHDSVEPAPP
jgi:hypothetical protein